jgi:hypothetical protein
VTNTPDTPTATRTPTVPTRTPTNTKCPTCGGYVDPPIVTRGQLAAAYLRYHQISDEYLRSIRFAYAYRQTHAN